MRKGVLTFLLVLVFVAPAGAQAVLFDGVVVDRNKAAAVLVPAVITGNDYTVFGRLDYGIVERVNFFFLGGGTFDGGSTGFGGAGWSATLIQQNSAFPLNIGLFNSFVFPLEQGGPDALVTIAPVFSHWFVRKGRGQVVPYGGVSATLKIGGRGTDVNGVLGLKVTEIAPRWDFIAELQPGERNQFAVGFIFRF